VASPKLDPKRAIAIAIGTKMVAIAIIAGGGVEVTVAAATVAVEVAAGGKRTLARTKEQLRPKRIEAEAETTRNGRRAAYVFYVFYEL
jgi:hypothetical protein